MVLTCVYAFPQPQNRKSLWSELDGGGVVVVRNTPWCIGGDMNAGLTMED